MSDGLLCDQEIALLAREHGMISPYVSDLVRHKKTNGHPVEDKVISYGQSSYGYDIRVAEEYLIFSNATCRLVDPKNVDKSGFAEVRGDYCVIPPNSFALARSVERFQMPENVTGVVIGKSTYARCGVIVNCTPMEAGWRGYLTIEISNSTPVPVKVYSYEGIAQVLFFRGRACRVSYATRAGKYQDQAPEIVLPRL